MKFATFVCVGLALLPAASESRGRTSLQVTIRQLIKSPEQFNGKTISVIAYYAVEHHGPYLCADAKTARKGTTGIWRIYPDFQNSPLSRRVLNHIRPGYVLVTGRFQYRRMTVTKGKDFDYIVPGFGWMNIYDKQITNITTFTKARVPDQ